RAAFGTLVTRAICADRFDRRACRPQRPVNFSVASIGPIWFVKVATSPRKVIMAQDAAPTPQATSSTQTKTQNKIKPLPPYHVVLLDDNDHSVEYVMAMLNELFAVPHEAGYELAMEVDRHGRAVVLTTHKERAELKREQIHAYGPD